MSKKNTVVSEVVRVPISLIKENPKNYEIYSSTHSKEDEDLYQSIKLYGQLEPCLVNKKNNQLISGHRRYNTIKNLNINTIDVIYREVDDLEILELIQSNRHREKSMVEKVNEYRELKNSMKSLPLKRRRELMKNMNLREYLHNEVGISQTNDARLKLIEDSGNEEIINQVLNGEISMKKALSLINTEGSQEKERKSRLKYDIKKQLELCKGEFSYFEILSLLDEVYTKE